MNYGLEQPRARLAELGGKRDEARPRRPAESIAQEAYPSSRIEGCRVDYTRLLEMAQAVKAGTRRP